MTTTNTETRKPGNTVSNFCNRRGWDFAKVLELMTLRDQYETASVNAANGADFDNRKGDKSRNAEHWEAQAEALFQKAVALVPGGWGVQRTALGLELVDANNATEQIPQLECVLHCFRFDTDTDEGLQGWKQLKQETGLPFRDSPTTSNDSKALQFREWVSELDGERVILETAFLFDNQWNSAPWEGGSETGLRLMDSLNWLYPGTSGKFKSGYWLELSDDCQTARDVQRICGYCGARSYGEPLEPFCGCCLDSPYLEESRLPLLRLLPVSGGVNGGERPELSEAERAELVPRFVEAQTVAKGSRAVKRLEKQKQDTIETARVKIEGLKIERDGKLWLLERSFPVDNVIYYNHTGEFCFGWRKPISRAEWDSRLAGLLMEFPFPWKIKGEGLPQELAPNLDKSP